jgi:glyoxylase I family protein
VAAIKTVGLDHVVLRVADIDRARTWYEGVLGAKAERILPSFGLTQLRIGSALIDLVDVSGPLGKKGGALPGLKRRNMEHYCVQLAEFDEKKIVAHLNRKGVIPGKVERRYGAIGHGPSMYLTDPDGNTVELKGPPDPDQTEKMPNAIWPVRRRRGAR